MDLPKRKQNRLKEYDYSTAGAYFVTICTHERRMLFGNIVGAIHESPEMILNLNGIIVDRYINQLNERFGIDVDKYVIMPNHIHLLITINERAIHESPLQRRSLISKVIGYLKMNVSRDIHQNGYSAGIWQRSYHDHVIRDERDYREIWDYIEDNPRKWVEDRYYTP